MLRSTETAGSDLGPLLDLGPQPVANRYRTSPGEPDERFPLRLGISRATGLVAQLSPAPFHEVRSRFSWIRYNEAEAHLDDLCDRLCSLPGVSAESSVLAVSYKDDSTVGRLAARGFCKCRRLEAGSDLCIEEPNAGLESLQERMTVRWAGSFVERHGQHDIVVARHVIEHAHRPAEFLQALRMLVKRGGYIVLEVPDCSKFLDACDYTMAWEEHITYFTPATFRRFLADERLEPVLRLDYPYALENSLVAVLRNIPSASRESCGAEVLEAEVARAVRYAEQYAPFSARMRESLAAYRREKGRIAILGAGHLACAFVNVLGVGESIDMIVDDAAEKKGLYLPGCSLPIRPSSDLLAAGIRLCLLSVNHDSADRVIAKNSGFVEAGNEFRSIFRTGPLRLDP